MAYSTTYLYPEDLNGNLPSNLISNEPQTLQAPGPNDYYFIIPKAAPFFVDSLKVVLTSTGQTLVEGDDYQVGHLFIEAMDSIGRPIAGSIRFMKPTIVGQVKLTYRTVGGNWGFSDQAILRELSNKHLNPLIRSWGDIDVLPYAFPPLPHDQSVDTLVGSAQINTTLNRIADILEASAAGTSASHINNKNNPHEVTKAQVQLGNVPNFAMATDSQHTDATRNDLFTNPRGVLLLVNKFAVAPLNAHINAKGNVHDMVPADIGLGNVPNWRPATPQQAIDPTNNNTFMTPYLVSLLIQKLQNDPRLDQLIIDFNAHLTAQNPHNITPALIGTYTSAQIDAMIDEVSQGGDAVTFDGKTPEEWVAMFPSVADINAILDELTTVWQDAVVALTAIDVTDPVTPGDIATKESKRAIWALGQYDAYSVHNSLGEAIIMADTAIRGNYPTGPLPEAVGKWSTAENAAYYIMPDGSVSTWGTSAITIPAIYRTGTMTAGNQVASLYASKDYIYLYLETEVLRLIERNTNQTTIGTIEDVGNIYVNNGLVDARPFAVAEISPAGGTRDWQGYGDDDFAAAIATIKSRATTGGFTIEDMRIGSDYLLVQTLKDDVGGLWVYRLNYGASITVTDVSASTFFTDHSTGLPVAASALTDVVAIDGSYDHFMVMVPIGPDSPLHDIFSFGDNSDGQREITSASGPFIGVAAGYKFTVTINSKNYTEFWGDSPDNSLYWRDGAYVDVGGL